MSNVAVLGTQWGDEGKGKIVDWLSVKADVIVRFQGGDNAGHTLVVDNNTTNLQLLTPSLVRKNKISVRSECVIIGPVSLLNDIQSTRKLGTKITNRQL